jgi:hypothetical protein
MRTWLQIADFAAVQTDCQVPGDISGVMKKVADCSKRGRKVEDSPTGDKETVPVVPPLTLYVRQDR